MTLKDSLKTSFVIILIFTGIDSLLHLFGILPELNVLPTYYFLSKIIFGTLILLLILQFTQIKNILLKALIVSGGLQLRYFFSQSYNNLWMIGVHAISLWIAYYVYERWLPNVRFSKV